MSAGLTPLSPFLLKIVKTVAHGEQIGDNYLSIAR